IPVAGCAHQAGTTRFGTDPATSVLDVDCRAHELDNLYVVDTSVFPSIGAVNPALTAMANSLRVGDHLLDRLGATSGAQTTTTAAVSCPDGCGRSRAREAVPRGSRDGCPHGRPRSDLPAPGRRRRVADAEARSPRPRRGAGATDLDLT